MTTFTFDISMSLDGFIAGPNMSPDQGLGEGGERLHEWAFATESFRESHGDSGGERGTDSEVLEEMLGAAGAIVIGRNMFGGGTGPWGEDKEWGDEPWEGWWGDEPPFHRPAFVVTHHEREPLLKGETTFTFVTDGIESALEQAQAAAGDKTVALGGGADVAQQYLKAGLLDEMQIHIAPVLLGQGVRLFDGLGPDDIDLEIDRVIESPAVTHVRYRVVN
jgi:dihydrofolate reductase